MPTHTIMQNGEALPDVEIGRDNAALGPSDTSDSGSDVPESARGSDSDSQGTGDRAGVEPIDLEARPEEIEAEHIVSEDEAGVSHTPPDPVQNAGRS